MLVLLRPHHESQLEILAHYGQIASGASFAITALVAVFTLFVVNGKRADAVWLDKFRNLYGEFWNDPHMKEARKLLINKDDYDQLSRILLKRNNKEECDLSTDEYDKLDEMDNFFSIMARVRSFAVSTSMTRSQKELWGDLLFNFWIEKIKSRQELKVYVEKHWTNLLVPFAIIDRKWYKINI